MKLTRRYRFSASHRLHSHQLSEERNQETYGKCNNPYGHGHNYILEVTVAGPIESETGQVMNLSRLDEYVRREVVLPYDHRNMNEDLPDYRNVVPTTENVALNIAERLHAGWNESFAGETARLERIKIFETPRNIFEVS